jgi:hypothetical protein
MDAFLRINSNKLNFSQIILSQNEIMEWLFHFHTMMINSNLEFFVAIGGAKNAISE